MSRRLIVGYRVLPARSGMRVWSDGVVELSARSDEWRRIGVLPESAVGAVAAAVREAGIASLPEETPAPPGLRDGSDCEWTTEVDGRLVAGVIRGWVEGNPLARASRALVSELSAIVRARGT